MSVSSLITVRSMKSGVKSSAELKKLLKSCVLAALEYEKIEPPCLVEILLTDDKGLHELNNEYRGVDRATDVLSFPMLELTPGEQPEAGIGDTDSRGRIMLGEIVISLERAAAQAIEYGHSYEREAGFLAVHSVLHLLGYDHERSEEDERIHFGKQEEILNRLELVRYGD